MNLINQVYVEFASKSINEGFARSLVSSLLAQIDPIIEEVEDVKTVVSEVVTNSIIHGYENKDEESLITLKLLLYEDSIEIVCSDFGGGIKNIEQARQPLFTSKPDLERSGLGFTIMENFMDDIQVTSEIGKGTTVKMHKKFHSVASKIAV